MIYLEHLAVPTPQIAAPSQTRMRKRMRQMRKRMRQHTRQRVPPHTQNSAARLEILVQTLLDQRASLFSYAVADARAYTQISAALPETRTTEVKSEEERMR